MRRTLGLIPMLATIYFCVSGGPFGLEDTMKSGAGMAILLILITPIIWSAPAALMTAELSSAIPDEGGYYVWVKRAMGKRWGFLCAWWSWVDSWVDVAIYPTLFAAYTSRFMDVIGYANLIDDHHPWIKWGIGLIVIVPMTLLNLRGTKITGESSTTLFVALLAPFVLLVLFGMSRVFANPSAVVHPFAASGGKAGDLFSLGLITVMWNYLGWDTMSTVSGEVKNPQRTYPKAIAIGVPLVVASYLLPALVGLAVLHKPEQWEDGAWVQVANLIGGKGLAVAMTAAGMVSSAGQFCSTLLAGSRIPCVLAEDRFLPRWLAWIHPRYGTPWVAILVSAVFYTTFSFSSFQDLTVIDVVMYSSALVLEFVALFVLRVKAKEMVRPFKIPGGWPVLGFVVVAPTALVVFACIGRFQKEPTALEYSAIALATGPAVLFAGELLRRKRGQGGR